jgi:hypothetical protein
MSIIPENEDVDMGRIAIGGQSRIKVAKTPSQVTSQCSDLRL